MKKSISWLQGFSVFLKIYFRIGAEEPQNPFLQLLFVHIKFVTGLAQNQLALRDADLGQGADHLFLP